MLERARSFPFQWIHGSDLDRAKLDVVNDRLRHGSSRGITIRQADATRLDGIDEHSVDVVVTDPPWGEYEKENVGPLYARFLERLRIVLKPEGRVVLLLSRSAASGAAIEASPFEVVDRYDMLVSGRKATALRLVQRTEPATRPGPDVVVSPR